MSEVLTIKIEPIGFYHGRILYRATVCEGASAFAFAESTSPIEALAQITSEFPEWKDAGVIGSSFLVMDAQARERKALGITIE